MDLYSYKNEIYFSSKTFKVFHISKVLLFLYNLAYELRKLQQFTY